LLREEFRLLKLILHSELRRRAASRRALPCPSSVNYAFIFVLYSILYTVAYALFVRTAAIKQNSSVSTMTLYLVLRATA